MRVLVVAATRPEVAPLLSALTDRVEYGALIGGAIGSAGVEVLLTGVGMVATSVWTARALATGRYDLALNLGVCGSFTDTLPPPSVVHVTRDALPELGAEDGPQFLPLQELGLLDPDTFPYTGDQLVNTSAPPLQGLASLPRVSGITVNTVHGDDASIRAVSARCRPDVESMEGAAFMFACLVERIPFAQVRAVSNRVERRNRAAWDLAGAVRELNRVSLRLLETA